jgi:hypothetical protein
MVTTLKSASIRREAVTSAGWITLSPKRVRLSSPITQHAVPNVRTRPVTEEKVESEDDLEGTAFAATQDYNIVIKQSSFLLFISNNFACKHCHESFRDRSILVDKIGFASNVSWHCSNEACPGQALIRATTCQVEASGKCQQKNPTTPGALSDYAINRQVVLACQQSGGGARMASKSGGLLLLSERSIWIEFFSKVEQ